ncbi:SLC13 family permease [Blastococcus sp. CT_GayMR16]|uniref:SLC13 family permease n=1 Tax=Blastococcus sp. CT_GayMR16 TaxID=2559607 RepID=UPI0010734AE0|nr:SLC13 family permease [Blastococcus sp. CT_GayMR16]TFV89558.1 arsenic transporter [Blastococcus sp. CT_GayMR16]
MVDLLALGVSAIVLLATLIAATAAHQRVPPVSVALPGAAFLVLVGAIGAPEAEAAVREIAPPVAFLVVLLLLSHLADGEGLFTWAAAMTARRSGRSARALLARIVVLSAVVTAVLSLDATVVLLTPVVVATAAHLRVPPLPHAYATGHLANSASLLLPVSNLTNLLAFAATGLSFLHFTGLMLAPWLVAVAVEFAVLRWLFRAQLATLAGEPVTVVPPAPAVAIVVVGLVVVGFGAASLAGLSPVWPAVAGVLVLGARQLIRRTTRVADLVRAADLPFALFVLALAVVVLAVLRSGLEDFLQTVLPDGDALLPLLAVAGISAVLANLLNNLPATLALLPVAAVGGPGPVLAMLIGVNVGPNLTYVGSLANLLWRRVLGAQAPSSAHHCAVGLATVPLTLVAATTALWAALQL